MADEAQAARHRADAEPRAQVSGALRDLQLNERVTGLPSAQHIASKINSLLQTIAKVIEDLPKAMQAAG